MAAGSYVVQTQGLSKIFDEIEALNSLDLKVPKNSIFGFLGPNGAGKTTTMTLYLGLTRASSGGGTVFGLEIEHDSVEIRSHVGYLPQDPRFYEHKTASKILDSTARFFFKGSDGNIKTALYEELFLLDLQGDQQPGC